MILLATALSSLTELLILYVIWGFILLATFALWATKGKFK